ncbi:hypothetical protein PR202_ga22696 [Eleusine coracana subsp. coracana]|uniref:HMA domain-containing protein n=1 Tax=Eleusine coracana subsp. coracana TaxID=191504 RepID=A0AAV5D4U5_ELECO|nr:hypothetical protein PR202_ga22696 [Eleusine coracana subsp. coracana]
MPSEKSRSKALALAAALVGMYSLYHRVNLLIILRICHDMTSADSARYGVASHVHTGVNSIRLAGDGKDQLVVVGDCVDTVCLVKGLRKKVGHAEILQVEEVKDKKPHERKDGDLFEKPDLQLPEYQPEGPSPMVPVRHRRRTFNMSKVHQRRIRLPVVCKPRRQHLSSQRSSAFRVLPLFVWCALCAVMLLLASVWALI